MREIDTLYLHYSASGDLGNAQQSYDTIDRWHKNREPPFKCFGYHGGTTPRGERIPGRPDWMVGAHVKYHNATSLGFVCIGDDLGDTPWFPTDAQYKDAAAWCREKMALYDIPVTRVRGHRDDNPTSCPGPFDVHGRLRTMILEKPQPEEEEMGLAATTVKMRAGDQYRYPAWLSHANKQLLWLDVTSDTDKAKFRFQPRRDNGDWIGQAETDSIEGESVTKRCEIGEFFNVREIGGLTLKVECLEGEMTVKFAESSR